jgi:hypothetical protein
VVANEPDSHGSWYNRQTAKAASRQLDRPSWHNHAPAEPPAKCDSAVELPLGDCAKKYEQDDRAGDNAIPRALSHPDFVAFAGTRPRSERKTDRLAQRYYSVVHRDRL